MTATDFKTLQANRRKNILKLIAATETAAVSPNDYALRRKVKNALGHVSLEDVIVTAQDSAAAIRFYKAAQRLIIAQNTHHLKNAATEILTLRSIRWLKPRPDTTTPKRTVRPRADVYS